MLVPFNLRIERDGFFYYMNAIIKDRFAEHPSMEAIMPSHSNASYFRQSEHYAEPIYRQTCSEEASMFAIVSAPLPVSHRNHSYVRRHEPSMDGLQKQP